MNSKSHFTVLIILILLLLPAIHADSEKIMIHQLLEALEKSEAIFFKDSIPYSSHEGRIHIESYWIRSGITVTTVEDFIEKIATKDAITGHYYYLKLETGEKIMLSEWLKNAWEKAKLEMQNSKKKKKNRKK